MPLAGAMAAVPLKLKYLTVEPLRVVPRQFWGKGGCRYFPVESIKKGRFPLKALVARRFPWQKAQPMFGKTEFLALFSPFGFVMVMVKRENRFFPKPQIFD
ncbi:MAG: hypothetical protein CM15mP46_6690 [Alphaproteobacteria bacterium]|nr:MAG: hypothetical protein CM15mP46_6690 [Alphaproteobacteria bacterium]